MKSISPVIIVRARGSVRMMLRYYNRRREMPVQDPGRGRSLEKDGELGMINRVPDRDVWY